MIFRVRFKVSYMDAYKDFDSLWDACNYAAEIQGTKYEEGKPIKGLSVWFIKKEDEEEEAPTASDDNESSTSAHA